MKTITDIPEDKSNNTALTKEFKTNFNEVEKVLSKKYSMGSFKSMGSNNIRMTPIDEREEIESPTRRSLKK